MKFFLVFMLCLIASAGSARAGTSLENAQQKLREFKPILEAELQIDFSLRFLDDQKCEASAGGGEVDFCLPFMRKVLEAYGEKAGIENLTFVLFHEVSHLVLSQSEDVKAADLALKLGVGIDKVYSLIYCIDHENTDGLALKLFREFTSIDPHQILEFNDNMMSFASTSDYSEEDIALLNNVQSHRSTKILAAYNEGWDSWSGFNKLQGPCTESFISQNGKTHIYDYLMGKSDGKMADDLGGAACALFSEEELEATVNEYWSSVF